MGDERVLVLRYPGACDRCGESLPQGTKAVHNRETRRVRHLDCAAPAEAEPAPVADARPTIDPGVAGASARREHERRRSRDEARIAARTAAVHATFGSGFWGRVATMLAVDDRPRRSTEVWAAGAVGEERVADRLDRLAEVGVVALHDRRIPWTRANIDHIAITPWGVWVVDAKRYRNKRPDVVIEGGLFGIGGTRRLTVGGRRKDELVEGVLRQVAEVRRVLGDAAPVRGALAFVDADWPLIGGDFVVRDVAVVWPRRLAKLMLRREAPTVDVDDVSRRIAERFPSA